MTVNTNWKEHGRKVSWTEMRYHPKYLLGRIEENMGNLSYDNQFPCRDLKYGTPKYKTGALAETEAD
jgi:hypothetical protein